MRRTELMRVDTRTKLTANFNFSRTVSLESEYSFASQEWCIAGLEMSARRRPLSGDDTFVTYS